MVRILFVLIGAGVLCFATVQALSEEMQAVIRNLHTTCQTRTGVPEDMIQNCRSGQFADDNRLKCYFMCIMTEMAMMDEEGIIDVESTIAILPDEFKTGGIPETIRKCGTQTGVDNCDTAWRTHKCYYEDNPKTLSDRLEKFFKSVHEKCKEESGATEDSIRSSENGGTFAEDYAYKCYLKCTMIELGTMNEHGQVDVDAAIAKLPPEMLDIGIDHFIRTCGTQQGADDCETGWLTLKCYQSVDPKKFITI